MIVTLIMDLLKTFVLFLISLLPSLPASDNLIEFVKPLFGIYSNLDSFISVGTCCFCLGLLFIFCNIEFIWGIIMWIVRKIPGVS